MVNAEHMFWCLQASLKSEMKNLTFSHIKHFRHRHFPEAQHDFRLNHPDDFLMQTASDMAGEALDQEAALQYMRKHKQPSQYTPQQQTNPGAADVTQRLTLQNRQQARRLIRQRRQVQPKAIPQHFFINKDFKYGKDTGNAQQSSLDNTLTVALYRTWHMCRYSAS